MVRLAVGSPPRFDFICRIVVVAVEKEYAKAALDRHIDGRDFYSVGLMDGSAVSGGANGGGLDHSVFRCGRGKI